MASQAQLAANTANAQHSTGPRTPEGKTVSAQNSRKHGLTSKDLVIGADEQPEFDLDPAVQKDADRLALYYSRTERSYYRALRELRSLQTSRAVHAGMIPPARFSRRFAPTQPSSIVTLITTTRSD
jgi:hypothetical protein